MPIVPIFLGIVIRFFHHDHPPNGYELCPDALRARITQQRPGRAA